MTLERSTKLKMVLRSTLFGSVTTIALSSCCVKPKPKDPSDNVIVVEKSEIVINPDGSFTVNKAWMLKRMETEKKLADALEECLVGEQ